MNRIGRLAAIASLVLLSPAAALAEWPESPIRLIVPTPQGDMTELVGSALVLGLSNAVRSQPVTLDNQSAGGLVAATEKAAKAAPDGHTLLVAPITALAVNAALYKGKVNYDLQKDFVPIALVGAVPMVLVVGPALQTPTLAELIALAKSKPGSLTYASTVNAGPQHLTAEYFKGVAGVDFTKVPYKSTREAMADVESGKVSVMFSTAPDAMNQIRTQRLRPLVITTGQRVALLPDAPGSIEAGLANFEASAVIALLAPAGTPQPIVARLNEMVQNILKRGDLRERILRRGAYATPSTPQQARQRIDEEVAKWAKVVGDAGIKPAD